MIEGTGAAQPDLGQEYGYKRGWIIFFITAFCCLFQFQKLTFYPSICIPPFNSIGMYSNGIFADIQLDLPLLTAGICKDLEGMKEIRMLF